MRLILLFLLVVAGAAFLLSQGFTASTPAREYIYFGGNLVAMESVTSQGPAAVSYSPPNGTFSGPGGVFKVIVSDPNGAAMSLTPGVGSTTQLDSSLCTLVMASSGGA
jgi:hypothetical protein